MAYLPLGVIPRVIGDSDTILTLEKLYVFSFTLDVSAHGIDECGQDCQVHRREEDPRHDKFRTPTSEGKASSGNLICSAESCGTERKRGEEVESHRGVLGEAHEDISRGDVCNRQ